ncbi:hypothetical protein [Nioella sp.]|uniref:hypothetical protein n=1 Tax=Nioella sp. TaxID=1912091 RepID=UPI003A8B4FA1
MTIANHNVKMFEMKPPAAAASVTALFVGFVTTLPALIQTERDLCGYSGQDPAVDRWIAAADAALAQTRAACEAMIAAPAIDEAERAFQAVARLYLRVIRSEDPDEVAGLRAHVQLRRWAWLVPGDGAGARDLNIWIGAALDALESWLALEDPFDARIEDWGGPELDGDIGPSA